MNVDLKEPVKRAMSLAKLDVGQDQRLLKDIQRLLEYVEQISEVDTSDTEPMFYPFEGAMDLRDDRPVKSLSKDTILASAPKHDGDFFIVPRVVEDSN